MSRIELLSNEMPSKRFFLTACAIMKDEAQYLLEWIAFHRLVGFEFFYIYDNDSVDHTRPLLAPLERHGICRRISWPRSSNPENPQVTAYRNAVEQFSAEAEWMAIIDADEFVVPLKTSSVSDVLRRNFAASSSVVCNWKVFGSAGCHRNDGKLCLERFVWSSTPNYQANRNVKSIVRPDRVEMAFIHNHHMKDDAVVCSGGTRLANPREQFFDPVYEYLQINHYFCKSKEEFMKKRLKGLADYALDAPNAIRAVHMFESADTNDVQDFSAFRFLEQMKAEISRLMMLK